MPSYIELHAHSYFSLLDGASSPEALVARAAALGMSALALTDHDTVYGAVRFDLAAQQHGLHPLLGAEVTLADGHHMTLLVESELGWQNLCWLLSRGRALASKGQAALPADELPGHTDGLIALSGCAQGALPSAVRRGDWTTARTVAAHYRELFGPERYWIELQDHGLLGASQQHYKLVTLARRLGVGYVATNNVHYATPAERPLHDVLTCIRTRTTLDDCPALRPTAEYYLKSADEMRQRFTAYPLALRNTLRIAERCQFRLRYGLQDMPAFPTPDGLTTDAYLQQLCAEGLRQRLPDAPERAAALLRHELDLIRRAGLSNYFLIVWDVVRYAREQGIRCQGRGSAANSLVAYLLFISPISPLTHDLVFERFLSDERRSTPDIDIDFQADRREEVIQYVYQRYGADHAAMACTFVTFRERSAIREVGRALGLPLEVVDSLAKGFNARNPGKLGTVTPPVAKPDQSEPWTHFEALVKQIQGLPRHLSIHNGGMVVTGSALAARLPTEPATMTGRRVVQWDKESLEDAGLIKIDLLGLRMLSAVAEAAQTVQTLTGAMPDLDALTLDDPAVFQMIQQADTIGVFQVESRAQQQVLPRMKPDKFNDLVISISLIRPGPIQGNMVHPYLRRRLGEEQIAYPHRLLEPALAETLGVILFQEQVLKVARDMGRFTPGEGEQLRRALGKGRAEDIARFEAAFVQGAGVNGVSRQVATAVFAQLKAFGGYSFPKSHAAAFAVLVYQSAWLKCHHPLAFYTALLNHQPMGFWSPSVLVNDAKRHGLRVLNVDIHRSDGPCRVEDGALRLGLKYVTGLGEQGSAVILAAREQRPFADLHDFCRRTRLPTMLVERLILAGAMDAWGPRRDLLWRLGEVTPDADTLDLHFIPEPVRLPPLTRAERMEAEYLMLGLTTGDHVLTLYRDWLRAQGVLSSEEAQHQPQGKLVKLAGQVVVHQAPPTAKGHHFLTLEDEDGMVQAIFRPQVYEANREAVHDSPLLIIEGSVQRKDGVVNVMAVRVVAMG
jgi:error-prone DNA polymerase